MTNQELIRLRAFLIEANSLMNALPLPVPPTPLGDAWEGAVLDVGALHQSYNRLSAPVQDAIADAYGACLSALDDQRTVASARSNAGPSSSVK